MQEEYKIYAELTPWDDPMEEDKRNYKKKIIDGIVQCMPKNIIIKLVSIIYNNSRVKKIQKEALLYRR